MSVGLLKMFVRVILLREIKPGDGNKFESKPCDCK